MKISKSILTFLAFGFTALMTTSCQRDLIENPEQYTKIYMPQAVESPLKKELIMADTLQSIVFGAAFGGAVVPDKQIDVTFKTEANLVASFNTANNTNYAALPEGSFQIDGLAASILPGQHSTAALKVKVKTVGGLEALKDYLLPISIDKVSPGLEINPKLRTAYFLIKGTFEEFNRSGWTVTGVSSEESTNPGKNVFDNNTATNWHTAWRNSKPPHPHWITVDMGSTKSTHGFYFWPANVANGNPQNVRIELSTDGQNWKNAGDFVMVNTFVKQFAYFSETIPGRYFKITITTSTGNTHFTHPAEIGAF